MAITKIDNEVYKTALNIVRKKRLEYPSMANYVSRAVDNQNKKEVKQNE